MEKIKSGDLVKLNYTGKLNDGTIFDSSLTENREPLVATIGKNQLIKGFEDGLIGMSEGDKKSINIKCEMAYGIRHEDYVLELSKSELPDDIKIGDALQGNGPNGPIIVTVKSINEDKVTVDYNHPLAGKDLNFDVEILKIN